MNAIILLFLSFLYTNHMVISREPNSNDSNRNISILKNDFRGDWILDASTSDLGGIALNQACLSKMKIIISYDSVTTIRNFGSDVFTDRYDVKSVANDKKVSQDTRKVSLFKWLIKDQSFSIRSIYHTQNQEQSYEYERIEIYRLSPESDELALTRITLLPDRNEIVRAKYKKFL